MRPFRTVFLATGLVVAAFGTWYGLYLLPVLVVGVVVCAIRLLVACFSEQGNPLTELGWLLLCAAALPLIFLGRDLRLEQIEARWAPAIAALNAGAHPEDVDRPDDDCRLGVTSGLSHRRGAPDWFLTCPLTPPYERLSWDHDRQRFYVWD